MCCNWSTARWEAELGICADSLSFYNTNDRMNNDYILISLLWKPCIEFYLLVKMRACLNKKSYLLQKPQSTTIERIFLENITWMSWRVNIFSFPDILTYRKADSNDGGYTGDLWTPNSFPLILAYVLEMTVVTKYWGMQVWIQVTVKPPALTFVEAGKKTWI